jgi:hydrogenase maturation protein HypF
MAADIMTSAAGIAVTTAAETVRLRGIVQGVGMRPTVWRIAHELSLVGDVCNDGEGVVIRLLGAPAALDEFIKRLNARIPPLARIDSILRESMSPADIDVDGFQIVGSVDTGARTGIAADAAACPSCIADTLDPFNRRFRYPFTNCTHCGPRLSIIEAIPYDRANTSMSAFEQCEACMAEYRNPADRRFHAQPNACHVCGPRARLERVDQRVLCVESLTQLDDVDAACTLLQQGHIVAIKGIGGFHLAVDATCADAVVELRRRKHRDHKPLALMARTLDIIEQYCHLDSLERALLCSPQAPIVILQRRCDTQPARPIADAVAPDHPTLGFMLPYTPLHHLLLKRMDRPIVLTSANHAEEPQCTGNEQARQRLADIADYLLLHDRDIVNRIDDSVVRVMAGQARLLRRARGYAPASLPLPPGFDQAGDWLALGGELKNTFCLLKDGSAVVSQHMGDLEDAATFFDYERNLELYAQLFQHKPTGFAVDRHPEYLSSKLGREWALRDKLPLVEVQHHHAHIASCLADNHRPLDAPAVLGIALDGLGLGDDGALWGGEFLLADYTGYERIGTFKPVALPGATQAMREPWRNTYAHLAAELGWARLQFDYGELELVSFLHSKPLSALDAMIASGRHAPLASSCGRLFDAVAAAVGIRREYVSYEGQAAIELEAIVNRKALEDEGAELAYPFSIPRLKGSGLPYIEPVAMWQALLGDLILGTEPGVIAARFHRGLINAITHMAHKLAQQGEERIIDTIALSGGVFQNRILFEGVINRLEGNGFTVLAHRNLPANDAGLSLGQAVVAAAQQIQRRT